MSKVALFYHLPTEKDFKIPTQPERRERALRDLNQARPSRAVASRESVMDVVQRAESLCRSLDRLVLLLWH